MSLLLTNVPKSSIQQPQSQESIKYQMSVVKSRHISDYLSSSQKCNKQNSNSEIVQQFKDLFSSNKNNECFKYDGIDDKTAELVELTQETAKNIRKLYHISTYSDYDSFHKQLYGDKYRKIRHILKQYQDNIDKYKKEQEIYLEQQLQLLQQQEQNMHQQMQSLQQEESEIEDLEIKKQLYLAKMNDLIDQHNQALTLKDYDLVSQIRIEMINWDIQHDNLPGIKFFQSLINSNTSNQSQKQITSSSFFQDSNEMDNSSYEILSIKHNQDKSHISTITDDHRKKRSNNKASQTDIEQNNQTINQEKEYEQLTEYELDDLSDQNKQLQDNESQEEKHSGLNDDSLNEKLREDQV